MADHRNDVWGVGAFLVGVLAAFAVWLGSAGFIGEVLDDGLALGVGLTRAVVPVALIGMGIGLVMGGCLGRPALSAEPVAPAVRTPIQLRLVIGSRTVQDTVCAAQASSAARSGRATDRASCGSNGGWSRGTRGVEAAR